MRTRMSWWCESWGRATSPGYSIGTAKRRMCDRNGRDPVATMAGREEYHRRKEFDVRHHTDQRTIAQTLTAVATITAYILMPGATLLYAAQPEEALLSNTAQQLLDQDFSAARESIKRVAATNRSSETKKLHESVVAVAAMSECLIAPFRDLIGQEVSVPFPQGAELVRITGVDEEGRIKADKLLKVDARVAGTTPRDFALSDLDAGERFKLLGRDESPERQIMRGLLAWEAGRADAAKNFFAKSKNDLGKLLIARVDQVVKDKETAAAREQRAAHEAAAATAYEVMLKTAGVESMRKDTDRMVSAVRRKVFSEEEIKQIKHYLELLNGELAKTEIVRNNQPVLKCLALVRSEYPIEVDQATLDKALAKLNKDNPKEIIQAKFKVSDGELSLVLKNLYALVDLSALHGLPITNLEILDCNAFADLSPLRGMPLRSLRIHRCHKVADITPLQGMGLHSLTISGADGNSSLRLNDLSPLRGMPLTELSVKFTHVADLRPLTGMKLKKLGLEGTKVTDVTPLKGMPLEQLFIYQTRIPDLSPVKAIKGLEIIR